MMRINDNTEIAFEKTGEDHYWMNIIIQNPNTATSAIPAVINPVTLSQPILKNPRKYNLAVARFSVPTDIIPIVILPLATNAPLPNGAPYITLTYGGNSYQQQVLTYPANVSGSVYDPQQLQASFNNAAKLAFTALQTANPAVVATLPPQFIRGTPSCSGQTSTSTNNVSITYSELFNICIPWSQYNTDYVNGNIGIYFNTVLLELVGDYLIQFNSYNSTTGLDAKIITYSTGVNAYYECGINDLLDTGGAIPIWKVMSQAAPNSNYIQPAFIQFYSATFGQQQEIEYINSTTINTGTNLVSDTIISDFTIDPSTFTSFNQAQTIIYNPQIYRFYPLQSDEPLFTFNLQVYWLGRDGKKVAVTIAPGRMFSIKLLFLRKGLES